MIPTNNWLCFDDSSKTLFEKSKNITFPLSKETKEVIKKMIMYVDYSQVKELKEKYNLIAAVGIAAPQIGYNYKMYYVKLDKKLNKGKEVKYFIINPKLSIASNNIISLSNGEGCLSVIKNKNGLVKRYEKVIVEGYDFFLKQNIKLKVSGYLSIIFQHEQDHLNGKLYYHKIIKDKSKKIKLI